MERILSIAIIGATIVGGYVITNTAPTGQGEAQAVAPAAVEATAAPAPAAPKGGSPERTAYLQTCVADMRKGRTANPKFRYSPKDTPEKACECLLDTVVKGGLTDREIAILNRHGAGMQQGGMGDTGAEALRKSMEATRKMTAELGEKRFMVAMKVGMEGLKCPGVLPANMAELMGR